jgi:hypothetical protein
MVPIRRSTSLPWRSQSLANHSKRRRTKRKGALLEQFSGDPNVEKAMAEIEHAQEIEETFDKDFDGR